ncbi:DUF397 domain-containing protein [Streptomyces fuscigenes]|uniref:DUF397 domain-containing protein n=1 Tax=Streptomyces fuscigenes TaxID=1528880 RepID=UPI001F381D25|nr:DUF397 domain-containing protein [Streptomyces fuscigenes]MCF3963838.1 DUF397 domain-containing protein [Streptomyces fuscigenes]
MNIKRSEVQSLRWFKSSYSSGEGGECVEIAPAPAAVHIRDSKTPAPGILTVRPAAWSAFLALARRD